MRRYSHSRSFSFSKRKSSMEKKTFTRDITRRRMKGQWFLISAVIASSIFLTISFALKSFFSVDTSAAALYDEHYYFFDIKYNVNEIKLHSGCSIQNNGLT